MTAKLKNKTFFSSVTLKVSFPQLEEKIIDYWKKNKIFEKSVLIRPEDKRWNFLDGPPFVTGMPHYGHLLGSIHKDVFGRYHTMKGYRVRRVWGWDGHGLPIENKVEGKLGIKRKKDIEDKVGIKRFVDECRKYVEDISSEWEWYVDHVGRWVDFKNAYKTWDTNYMESVMWVFKQMYDKGHIYKGLRVSLYCPHCATPISNFEVSMDPDNYKEIKEPANTYKYKVKGDEKTYFLAWSTTPWNKIATPALAVNPKLNYVRVKQGDEYYILAKNTLNTLNASPAYKIVKTYKGKELLGLGFEPHYNFYKIEEGKKAFVVIPGNFVTDSEGTGIVTIAAYGEDDLKAMQENNIQIVLHVDDEGVLKPEVPNWAGMYYLDVNEKVNNDLKKRELMYKEEDYVHSVPTCWRCHTRLYYAPLNAWFVDIQSLKPLMKKTNQLVNWFPKHFKYGRFLKSMENAPDWNISRNRYWGSPVPVWECECGERFVPGSIEELEKRSGRKIRDLHKPEIDEVVIKCQKCGKNVNRVPEVLDSWIEAGSASFAERHFPFENGSDLSTFFPPDFIAEYTGQIRAWFYVLHVIGASIYASPAFKNVCVEGVILGTDGKKMSKNLGNYPDPKELINKYGGDALRLYLMGSPVMHGEDMIISEEDYRNQVRGMILVFWNIYNYFVTYANLEGWKPKGFCKSENPLDIWIISLLNRLIIDVTQSLDNYDTVLAVNHLKSFIDNMSSWYIRRSREREDRKYFNETAYFVLTNLCQLSAPIMPFVSEEIFINLTKKESVHLTDWPKPNKKLINTDLELKMAFVRQIVEKGHALRKDKGIKVRQPLAEIFIKNVNLDISSLISLIKDELNVKKVSLFYGDGDVLVDFDFNLTQSLVKEGEAREIVRKIQDERKKIGTSLKDKVVVSLPDWPKDFEEYIKNKALVSELKKGDFGIFRKK